MAIAISTISSLGRVLEEDVTLDNRIISMPTPLRSANNATAANLFGKTRRVNIQGAFNGTDAQIKAFTDEMNSWADAGTQTTRTYTSKLGYSYTVMCAVFKYTSVNPGTRILYVISMVQGSALAAFSPS